MRMLVPSLDDQGLGSPLADHFGRAPWYTIVDTATGDVAAIANAVADHDSASCSPIDLLLAETTLDAVACKGIGRRPLATLEAAGIPVYAAAGLHVNDVLEAGRAGRLQPVASRSSGNTGRAGGCGSPGDCGSPDH